jgi:hypothetical protein
VYSFKVQNFAVLLDELLVTAAAKQNEQGSVVMCWLNL